MDKITPTFRVVQTLENSVVELTKLGTRAILLTKIHLHFRLRSPFKL